MIGFCSLQLSKTRVRKLGYPCRTVLAKWIAEIALDQKRYCRSGGTVVNYGYEKKNRQSYPCVLVTNWQEKLNLNME